MPMWFLEGKESWLELMRCFALMSGLLSFQEAGDPESHVLVTVFSPCKHTGSLLIMEESKVLCTLLK